MTTIHFDVVDDGRPIEEPIPSEEQPAPLTVAPGLFAQHQLINHDKIARLTQILETEGDHLSDQKGGFESQLNFLKDKNKLESELQRYSSHFENKKSEREREQ